MTPRRTHARKPAAPRNALRRRLEGLEGRVTPAALSIGDATATEGSAALRFLDRFIPDGSGGLTAPARGSVFGPDGNSDGARDLYIASAGSNAILRYDGVTGTFLDAFVPPASGGLNSPIEPEFGPDGNLYVASLGTNQVLRYDGSSGAFLGAVVGGLNAPHGISFGPDGGLYIANQNTHEVLRYRDAVLSTFVAAGSGGLSRPRQAVFGPDGNGDGYNDLYVASGGTGQVLRYDGQTGALIGPFATTNLGSGPTWLEFGGDGYLYTTVRTTAACCDTSISRFSAATGAFVDNFALGRDGWSFIIGPDNLVYNSSNGAAGSFVERFGPASLAAFTVRLDAPATTPVTVQFATANGTAVAGSDYTAVAGTLTFAPGETAKTILVRTLDDTLSEGAETFVVNLSNAAGAVITDAQAVGTIADNEPPLLQVAAAAVNGGAAQRSRVTELTVTFNAVATLPADLAAAFRLTRLGPGGPAGDVTLAVDLSGSTAARTVARLTFGGPLTEFGSLVDGRYRLTILAAQASGFGVPLDGDANGVAGGDFALDLHRYYGDATGDGAVNGLDFGLFRPAFGTALGDPAYLDYLDFNGDGVINGLDFGPFRTRFGLTLP
jgi:hypothetical protein